MSAHNMDEWVSCADGMRGRADTESDAFSDAFAHGCANTVADGSADGESNAEPNAGTDAAVFAWRASRCWWRVCFVRAWSLQRHCECGAVQVVLYWSVCDTHRDSQLHSVPNEHVCSGFCIKGFHGCRVHGMPRWSAPFD